MRKNLLIESESDKRINNDKDADISVSKKNDYNFREGSRFENKGFFLLMNKRKI